MTLFSLSLLRYSLRCTATDATSHSRQTSAANASREYMPRASMSLFRVSRDSHTALEWLQRLVASSVGPSIMRNGVQYLRTRVQRAATPLSLIICSVRVHRDVSFIHGTSAGARLFSGKHSPGAEPAMDDCAGSALCSLITL